VIRNIFFGHECRPSGNAGLLVPSACISHWLDKHRLQTFSSLPTLGALSFGPRLKEHVSFHANTIVSATEVSLLPVLVWGTP